MADRNHPIAIEIREIREKTGLTQRQFVSLFNASPPLNVTIKRASLAKYETGAIVNIPVTKHQKLLRMPEIVRSEV